MSKSNELANSLKKTLWDFIENEKLTEGEVLQGILLITVPTISITENPEKTLEIYIKHLKKLLKKEK
jgi:hypothetical protein